MKVDFFVPGFSKCGTTTLCTLLGEHPKIFIPEEKEPNYFAHAYDRHSWDWYENFFKPARPGQLLGDGSTFYSTDEQAENACSRILERYPEAKFIFIGRDPIKRIESSYREFHHSGRCYGVNAPYSIAGALQQFPNMVADSMYWKLLCVYRRRVPDERILALCMEDLRKDPASQLKRCFEFLGVDPSVRIERLDRKLNPAEAKLYDTRLLRFLRTHPRRRPIWPRLPQKWAVWIEGSLGLRKPFTGPAPWDPDTRAWFVELVRDEARRYLDYCGKPQDYWKL